MQSEPWTEEWSAPSTEWGWREFFGRLPGACAGHRPLLRCVSTEYQIHTMRTNIVIDDKLMQETLRATGLKTKREAVEQGLRTLLRLRRQEEIRRYRGKLPWQGDLDAMRADR